MTDLDATYPQYLIPSRLAAGEDYATVKQILDCDDLQQQTVHVPYWRVDGKPMAIRVRALSLSERDLVLHEDDTVAQYCRIWQIGCIAPTFTADQASGLADKNPHAVELVATFILSLSALRQDWIERVVTAQINAPAAEAQRDAGGAGDSDRPARARRLDRPSVRKVRTPARVSHPDA